MSAGAPRDEDGRTFTDEDWYGEELGSRTFTDCTFRDVDLTEATPAGATFTGCRFEHSRLNASRHVATAFVGCHFLRTNLFDAERELVMLTEWDGLSPARVAAAISARWV